ncbi:hypothetical protein HF228_36155 [Rhizobium leguminosarum]|nr:hypothetical protein [Rhizobium leguminosarum]
MAQRLEELVEAVTLGAGLVAEMHVIKLCGYTLDNAAHTCIRCLNLSLSGHIQQAFFSLAASIPTKAFL